MYIVYVWKSAYISMFSIRINALEEATLQVYFMFLNVHLIVFHWMCVPLCEWFYKF